MDYYQKLTEHFRKTHRLEHLQAVCYWDQAAMMPAGGSAARGDAMAELALLIHRQNTAPELGEWFAAARIEDLEPHERRDFEEMHRLWQQHTVLPAALVEAKAQATNRCEHAWRTQRPANDWQGFSRNLQEVVTLAREEANLRAAAANVSPYDAMLGLFEPGMASATLDKLFGELKSWLPGLIEEVVERQKSRPEVVSPGPFPIAQQKQLGLEVMQLLGFDFAHGRLDVSTHPFCGGVPTDVRITTRYDEQDFMQALHGVIHETGHARYEQNLPMTFAGLPIGQARSTGVHESQSLFFEMQLARSRELAAVLAPMAARIFNREDLPGFTAETFYLRSTRVRRGFIRVNADEVTYPAHIILRYEIERALIEGKLEVEEIPECWDAKLEHYLGLDSHGNYRDGCMQDVHWPEGLFGYFPSYTLGALYAAQQFAAAQKAIPELKAQITRGELEPLFAWLADNIWRKASTRSTAEIMCEATGEALNPAFFKAHLQARYLV